MTTMGQTPIEPFPSYENICLSSVWHFWLWLFVFAVVIRVVISIFTLWAHRKERHSQWRLLWRDCVTDYIRVLLGYHNELYDLGITFLIGIGELAAYAVLIRFRQIAVIGAWLALKTAASAAWKHWQEKPTAYTRFLLGNMLTILGAFLLSHFVRPCALGGSSILWLP